MEIPFMVITTCLPIILLSGTIDFIRDSIMTHFIDTISTDPGEVDLAVIGHFLSV
jgi:hypothetical protein